MPDDIAIRVENLGKRYIIGRETPRAKSLAGRVRQTLASPFSWLSAQLREPDEDEILWALKDVSFEVKRGEVLGVIGRNGAGKSTLLKILSRITEPTTGHAEIHGRVGSLLEVGTGMHPELTGRENIYLNGTILGMKKAEIDGKFDEIVDFSGIERFLDTPVKRYSSGMRVRLGFAIAAHLEPEILVVDEVLAVGDAEFQAKCLGKMKDVAGHGRTVLFVSHNMAAVKRLCPSGIMLRKGSVQYVGGMGQVIECYNHGTFSSHELSVQYSPSSDPRATLVSAQLSAAMGQPETCFPIAVEAKVRIGMACRLYVGVSVIDSEGNTILLSRDFGSSSELGEAMEKGDYAYQIEIPPMTLVPGCYRMEIVLAARSITDISAIHRPLEHLQFSVSDTHSRNAQMNLPWRSLTAVPMKIAVRSPSDYGIASHSQLPNPDVSSTQNSR